MRRKWFVVICLLAITFIVQAQEVYKIDINEFSPNNMDEVLEPDFTPWKFEKSTNKSTLTMDDGVTFVISSDHNMRSSWNKAFVQSKVANSRLTGDGVTLDPNECGTIVLSIKGLAVGQHTIQTYHNSWQDPNRSAVWPVTVSLGDQVVHKSVQSSRQQAVASEACVLTTIFTVSSAEDIISLTFSTKEDEAPADANEREIKDKAPILNGFLIDAINTANQAKRPYPANADMHFDADDSIVELAWSSASNNVVKHRLYLSTDSLTTAQADAFSACLLSIKEADDTTHLLSNVHNLDTYYWRVDEETQDGVVTQGEVWRFRPRHLAFPSAEGYGRFANGGRGGQVVYVTNLNDDGDGSVQRVVRLSVCSHCFLAIPSAQNTRQRL